MQQAGMHSWSACASSSSLPFPLYPLCRRQFLSKKGVIRASQDSLAGAQLTARERRQLRSERRESKVSNWREEVEERLLKKPKKKHKAWNEDLNLDNLALLGPQWWVVRVSRVSGQATSEVLAKLLMMDFPDIEFKVYVPCVHVKRKLKTGSYLEKSNPLFPGCVFLWCVLNKEIHDLVRECPGVGGFLGSKVGNTKRQINRPKPIAEEEMEAIFRQAKEEQENADKAFREEHLAAGLFDNEDLDINDGPTSIDADLNKAGKSKMRTRRASDAAENGGLRDKDSKSLAPGSTVRVLSGPFAEFAGCLKGVDKKSGKATVGFMLFGKESLAAFDTNQIVADTE